MKSKILFLLLLVFSVSIFAHGYGDEGWGGERHQRHHHESYGYGQPYYRSQVYPPYYNQLPPPPVFVVRCWKKEVAGFYNQYNQYVRQFVDVCR